MPRYGSYRRRLGGKRGYTVGGPVAPFGTPLYPVPFTRKRPNPYGPSSSTTTTRRVRPRVRTGQRTRGRTAVQTRTKSRLFGTTSKTGENSSVSATRYGPGMSPFMKMMYRKAQGRKIATDVTTGSSLGTQGLQSILEWPVLTRTHLNTIKAAAEGGTASANNVKLMLGYVKQRLVIRNQSNCVAKLSLYDIVWKHNPDASSVDTVREVWFKGHTDMSVTSDGWRVGATPFNSAEFRRHCAVRRVTMINMEPGQQHTHTVYRKVNRLVNSTAWDNATLEPVNRLTSITMAVWHGALGHESATPANVSYMPVRMDWAMHLDYNYGFLYSSSPTHVNTGTLPTITDFDQMGENADADVNIENA